MPTTIEACLSAARQRLVNRGVVNDAFAFVVDDPDDAVAAMALADDAIVAVWWRELTQAPGDVNTDATGDEVPVAEADLMITCYLRVNLDQTGRAEVASASQSRGANVFVRRAVRALNDQMLFNFAREQLLMESLTFRRVANRGRVKSQDGWRRYDCQFDLMFIWDLVTPYVPPPPDPVFAVGFGLTAIGYGTTALGVD